LVARETAFVVAIHDLLSGQYVAREGWEPNFVETARGRVSRANILATVVGIEDARSIILDDGTGSMSCRAFEKDLFCKVGDVVLVIGRPRQFSGSLFFMPEILRVTDPLWIEHRKKVLGTTTTEKKGDVAPASTIEKARVEETAYNKQVFEKTAPDTKTITQNTPVQKIQVQESTPELAPARVSSENILDTISRLDNGDGVDIDEVIAIHGESAEVKITKLIEEGHVFACRPGRVKVL
jgi:hypothetical protein